VPPPIEVDPPESWQDLEARVAQILSECGYDVEVQKKVRLARGEVNIDVYAVDHTSPPNIFAFECKLWTRPATRSVVHAFRTVVGDSGANTGFIISTAGFQQGAVDAAAYSNVRLLDWAQFQEMFVERWFEYFVDRVEREAKELHPYTEPYNPRIFGKADALPPERSAQFWALRDKYAALGMVDMIWGGPPLMRHLLPSGEDVVPNLPLRKHVEESDSREWIAGLPDDVLDATALRPLLNALLRHYQAAFAEFDQVFGERA
jgi:restriction system protein